jgi:glycosyltransferase involved in cell wall biosynthesis
VRVLYIVTAFSRSADDVVTPWLVETIRRLGQAGVEVEVLAPAYRGLGKQIIHGVRVHRFRYAPARWETLTHDQTVPDRLRERPRYFGLVPPYLASGCLEAAALARSGRFDLTHAFWPIPHAAFGLAAKYAGGLPLVSTFFGVELTWVRNRLPALRPAIRQVVRRSDAVTVISSYTAALLREVAPGADPAIIPFGAAVDTAAIGEAAVLPRPAPADRPYTILFVGRLVERKGVPVLIEAVRRLRQRRDVRLEVVGDGPDRMDLETRAADAGLGAAARFRGSVSDAELARAYAECDLFVLPAVVDAKGDTEGLGVVLIEALLHGRPVVASGAGGIPDIVEHERTGLLVPPGDPDALARAIERYIDEPATASRHAAAGRLHVEESFSWDAIVARLRAVYTSVADRNPRRARRPAPPSER